MSDLNEPFACAVCGGTRFIELTQWNALVCRLETDEPPASPTMIACWGCHRTYQQNDWLWEPVIVGGGWPIPVARIAPVPEPRWACFRCSQAAGVLHESRWHITHRMGERCPAEEPTTPDHD